MMYDELLQKKSHNIKATKRTLGSKRPLGLPRQKWTDIVVNDLNMFIIFETIFSPMAKTKPKLKYIYLSFQP